MKIAEISVASHERVVRITDEKEGFVAFIALHSTRLGPAAGGLRMRQYSHERGALDDVLRLSEGMTFKNAVAGLPLGGGKAVILGDPEEKTPAQLRLIGRAIEHLGGSYWTAEDMGLSPEDLATVAKETRYVAGLDEGSFASGDPSPFTADGIYRCMKVALEHRFGTSEISGRRVAIQGLGSVGARLGQHLFVTGARLIVADTNSDRVTSAEKSLGAKAVEVGEIHRTKVDVLSPCAIGGVLNSSTIPELNCELVVGGANNQLANRSDADHLKARGILYAPDFVVNAGGIVNVATEILQVSDPQSWVETKLAGIEENFANILDEAQQQDTTPLAAACALVDDLLKTRATL